MTLTTEQLDKLTREDLLALVIQQQEIIALLQAEVAALKACFNSKANSMSCFRSQSTIKAPAI
jgi:uncharacterized small protein (DUF1192 family)